jgi:hypothetical protein
LQKLKAGSLSATLSDLKLNYGFEIVFMYICEAHSAENWPLSPEAPLNHKSLEDRVVKANNFLQDWPDLNSMLSKPVVVVDSLDDANTISNGLWPERYLLLREGKVVWASTFGSDSELVSMLEAASELFSQHIPEGKVCL